MPSANRMTTPVAVDEAQIEGRYAPLGDYTVSFETFRQDADPAPYFAGLPGDRCPCAHWGVVTAGQLTFRWPDYDETYVAGDAYYAPPGHLPLVTARGCRHTCGACRLPASRSTSRRYTGRCALWSCWGRSPPERASSRHRGG